MNRVRHLSSMPVQLPISDAAPSAKSVRKLSMALETALACLTPEGRAEFEERWETICRRQGFKFVPLG